ncbi:sugar porter family MFS transporter [Echinicola shivajiensis]|uniref:sugar porter family MFS transporter n=1 Tax=Echinicola shivajiensis TaxID=1035916 RepID=UPI001BFC7B4A|nr:sugar porter family MFS transporter [Echinicola shivajiensis]
METKTNLRYILFLSVIAAIGGFLFGYDTAVISGTVNMVASQFQLDSMEQGWYVGCALLGSILGVACAGVMSDYYGRKKMLLLSAMLFSVSAVGCAWAGNYTHLVIYRIIGGVGIGMVSIISPMYISEIAEPKYRGSLVSLYQLAITIGFLGAYLMNFELAKLAEHLNTFGWMELVFQEEVWRGMLLMEILPAGLFLAVLIFIPESPRWLIVRGQVSLAEQVFSKITGSVESAKHKIIEILSQHKKDDSLSVWELMKSRSVLRPILIGAAIAILGQFMGVNAVLYYGPTIFEQSGLPGNDALFYQVLVGLVNVLTTVLALLIIDKLGRKQLVYFGVSGMLVTLILISVFFSKGEQWGLSPLILLGLFLAYVFCTAISISAVIFVLLSEMYPNKIRGIAMSIAGFALWVGTYLVGQLTPVLLEELSPAGTFVLFAFMCLPYLYIIYYMVPETAGKSLEEIEGFWELEAQDVGEKVYK